MNRVGVTGHSNLPAETAQLVFGELRDALESYSGDGLLGITCLADGADQLFARAGLRLGGRYDVILPAPDYRTAVVKPHNLPEFDAPIAQAADVRYMPFETSGREAYMAASESLVARSDRLVAVWDGEPSAGRGGTRRCRCARAGSGHPRTGHLAQRRPPTLSLEDPLARRGRPAVGGGRVWSVVTRR